MPLTPDEIERYQRHILLKEIGGPGQQRLKAATVAIVGMGGLGAPAALYLAAAGIGRLVLIDPDTVALSNLQRQVLYRSADVGSEKVKVAYWRLQALNAHVDVDTLPTRLDGDNATNCLGGADVVLDGTDDFPTRFAVNAACHQLRIPLVSGAVGRWDGQVGVFASGTTKDKPADDRLPCYRCFVPEVPPGALTGAIGAMMALEAIKIITRAGSPLRGRLLIYDALAAQTRVVTLAPDPVCPVCGG